MIRVKLTQTGSLLPVWMDEEISEEQAEEIGRIVHGTCHLPMWQSVTDGSCTHADHAPTRTVDGVTYVNPARVTPTGGPSWVTGVAGEKETP